MPRGKSWLMATVALKFFLLSLHTSSLPRWGGLTVGRERHRQTHKGCALITKAGKSVGNTYFPCSAVIYSSQEIVLGAGAVRDCLLAGWAENIISQSAYSQSSGYHDKKRSWNTWIISGSPQSFVHWCCLLYSSSPWWLCSSRCPPRLSALAVSVTPAPNRSPNRSQPGSFQPSPVQKTSTWQFGMSYPVISKTTADFFTKCQAWQ